MALEPLLDEYLTEMDGYYDNEGPSISVNLGFGADLDAWIKQNSDVAQRLASVAQALREEAVRGASLRSAQCFETAPSNKEEELQWLEVRELKEECRRRDEELAALRSRARSADALRDAAATRLLDTRAECASLRQKAEELAKRNKHKRDAFEKSLSETSHLRGLIRQLNNDDGVDDIYSAGSSPRSSSPTLHPRSEVVGEVAHLQVASHSALGARPAFIGSAFTPSRMAGKSASTSTLRQPRPLEVSSPRLASPRPAARSASPRTHSVPRRVRFAERLQESPRAPPSARRAEPVSGVSSAMARSGSPTALTPCYSATTTTVASGPPRSATRSGSPQMSSPRLIRLSSYSDVQASPSASPTRPLRQLSNYALRSDMEADPQLSTYALRQVENTSSATSTDPQRYRTQLLSTVHRRVTSPPRSRAVEVSDFCGGGVTRDVISVSSMRSLQPESSPGLSARAVARAISPPARAASPPARAVARAASPRSFYSHITEPVGAAGGSVRVGVAGVAGGPMASSRVAATSPRRVAGPGSPGGHFIQLQPPGVCHTNVDGARWGSRADRHLEISRGLGSSEIQLL